jgi:hypothetical protein
MLQTSAERYSCEYLFSLLLTPASGNGMDEIPLAAFACRVFMARQMVFGDRI